MFELFLIILRWASAVLLALLVSVWLGAWVKAKAPPPPDPVPVVLTMEV